MINKIEEILERTLNPKEYVQCQDLMKDYEEKDILYWIYMAKFKDRPIDYARTCIISKCQKKNESSGSAWWDNLKKQLKEK